MPGHLRGSGVSAAGQCPVSKNGGPRLALIQVLPKILRLRLAATARSRDCR